MTHEKCTDYKTIFTRIDDMIKNYECSDKRVLEYIYQELQNEGIGWIPVSERLPEIHETVLLFDSSNGETVSGFKAINKQWTAVHDYFHGDKFDYITHWQPRPAPPNEAT